MSRFSRTVRCAKISRPSGTWLMPNPITRSGSLPLIAALEQDVALLRIHQPQIVLSTVVLPAPLAPSR